jgi:hypothetical protein
MRGGGGHELETRDEPTRALVCAAFERIQQAERRAGCAMTLKDLVHRVLTGESADELVREAVGAESLKR